MTIENDHKNVGVPQKLHRTTGTFRDIGENVRILWHATRKTERGYHGERGRNGQTVLGQIVGNMEQGKDIDYAKNFIGTNSLTTVGKMSRPNTRAILVGCQHAQDGRQDSAVEEQTYSLLRIRT